MYPVLIPAHTLGPSCESAWVSTRPSPPAGLVPPSVPFLKEPLPHPLLRYPQAD